MVLNFNYIIEVLVRTHVVIIIIIVDILRLRYWSVTLIFSSENAIKLEISIFPYNRGKLEVSLESTRPIEEESQSLGLYYGGSTIFLSEAAHL